MQRGFTLLLVDNEPNDVDLFRIAVENSGLPINLQTLDDGQRALDYLRDCGPEAGPLPHPVPDVIVMDLQMPRMDGFEVLSSIRNSHRFRSLPVVILTGSADASEQDRAYHLGATRFMFKPLGLPGLQETVREIGELWEAVQSGVAGEGAAGKPKALAA